MKVTIKPLIKYCDDINKKLSQWENWPSPFPDSISTPGMAHWLRVRCNSADMRGISLPREPRTMTWWRDCCFPTEWNYHLFKNNLASMYWLIFRVSILFHCSIYLSSCQDHTVLVTVVCNTFCNWKLLIFCWGFVSRFIRIFI